MCVLPEVKVRCFGYEGKAEKKVDVTLLHSALAGEQETREENQR